MSECLSSHGVSSLQLDETHSRLALFHFTFTTMPNVGTPCQNPLAASEKIVLSSHGFTAKVGKVLPKSVGLTPAVISTSAVSIRFP